MVEVQFLQYFHNVFKEYTPTLVIRNFQTLGSYQNSIIRLKSVKRHIFCIILELVAYKLFFFVVETNRYLCH